MGVSRAHGDQSIHAQSIIPFVFQEHTVTKASLPKFSRFKLVLLTRLPCNSAFLLAEVANLRRRVLRKAAKKHRNSKPDHYISQDQQAECSLSSHAPKLFDERERPILEPKIHSSQKSHACYGFVHVERCPLLSRTTGANAVHTL